MQENSRIKFRKNVALVFTSILIIIYSAIANIGFSAFGQANKPILYLNSECEFCDELKEYITNKGLEGEFNIILTSSEEERDDLRQIWDKYEIRPEDRAWPFLIISESDELQYIVGKEPIIEYIDIIYLDSDQGIGDYPQRIIFGSIILIIIGALIFLIWYKKNK